MASAASRRSIFAGRCTYLKQLVFRDVVFQLAEYRAVKMLQGCTWSGALTISSRNKMGFASPEQMIRYDR